jgi:6-phosphogluconolactonase
MKTFRHALGMGTILHSLNLFDPASCSADGQTYAAFVGTYTGQGSDGIYSFRFNPVAGACTTPELAAKTDNPSFLVVDKKGRFLYAINEIGNFGDASTGAISVFAIEQGSGKLTLLQQTSSLGSGPAHVSLDQSGHFLLVANYGGGNIAVFPVGSDGKLGEHSAFIQHSGATAPHAHYILVTDDNRFVLVADIGIDKIMIYRFDAATGSLTPNDPAFVELDPGAGPRHFVIAPSGKSVYVVNEYSSTVTAFDFDPASATMRSRQTISTRHDDATGKNTAAEIAIDAKGKYLYVSNRSDNSIAQFEIESASGQLTPVGWVSSGGKTPRHFEIDPTGQWLFAANQNSHDISLFQIDQESGRLSQTPTSVNVTSPACIRIVGLRR